MTQKLTLDYKTFTILCITLLFLSTSSVICRLALINDEIDAFSYSFFRIFFGVCVLALLLLYKKEKLSFNVRSNWLSSFMLFIYAISFSYSLLNLDAGLSTLILFAVVQLSMILTAVYYKEKINLQKLLGILIAFSGLFYLLYPNNDLHISIYHAVLMIISGLAWAFYSILGKNTKKPISHTFDNFLKALIFMIFFFIFFVDNFYFSKYGLFLAFLSGGITSALGYALWYYLLTKVEIIFASVIQLIVPPLSIFLSVIFLNEPLSLTLILSTIIILLGVYICLKNR